MVGLQPVPAHDVTGAGGGVVAVLRERSISENSRRKSLGIMGINFLATISKNPPSAIRIAGKMSSRLFLSTLVVGVHIWYPWLLVSSMDLRMIHTRAMKPRKSSMEMVCA